MARNPCMVILINLANNVSFNISVILLLRLLLKLQISNEEHVVPYVVLLVYMIAEPIRAI